MGIGGGRGIRTPDPLRGSGFQDRRLQPDSPTPPAPCDRRSQSSIAPPAPPPEGPRGPGRRRRPLSARTRYGHDIVVSLSAVYRCGALCAAPAAFGAGASTGLGRPPVRAGAGGTTRPCPRVAPGRGG